jgi:hypothetical protein
VHESTPRSSSWQARQSQALRRAAITNKVLRSGDRTRRTFRSCLPISIRCASLTEQRCRKATLTVGIAANRSMRIPERWAAPLRCDRLDGCVEERV